MNLSIGIIGLPNVGKSTLFNALLKRQQALVANYPFATVEPNIGIVPVPDPRLQVLADIVASNAELHGTVHGTTPPIKPATVEFVDIAGLVKGASEGAGLGNKFLSHIREVSVIAHVVRAFEDPNIVREGSVTPIDDYKVVRTELELADLEKGGEISKKPEIIVLNVSEEDYKSDKLNPIVNQYTSILGVDKEKIVIISAKIEAELASLTEDEQKEYLSDLGLEFSGLERLIQKAYEELGLISFLTAPTEKPSSAKASEGQWEVRAWTIRLGSTSLMASGEIHTDFMKKFIKAEVVGYDSFVEFGGWKGAREHGKEILEGRDYIVKDGDVIEFKIGS